MSRSDAGTVAFTDHHIAVYDGRWLLGEVLMGRSIRATDAEGDELPGPFKTQGGARQAIIEAAKAARAQDMPAKDGGA